MPSDFENRLRKSFRHLRRWAEREDLTAFRIYDLDIPEWPYAVDWYEGRVHLVEYPSRRERREGTEARRKQAVEAIQAALEISPERIFFKSHVPMPAGGAPLEPFERARAESRFTVREQGLRFWVELSGHLDTGLFLDHRRTRARVREEAAGKNFLNLFGYTGAFTVYAAAGGARATTTVDLSKTYLSWCEENLAVNGLGGRQHRGVRADVRAWLSHAASEKERWDLIVLDPPSFSSSKAMKGSLDIARDHPRLIADALEVLAPNGALYFSSNLKGFALRAEAVPARLAARFEELTPGSLPPDFRRKDSHRAWRITRRSTGGA